MYHLLIVDDETAITDGLEEVLLSSGLNLIEVRKAYSARQALELFQKRLFDIVISDIRMPGMDGLKMIEEMQKYWPDVRAVFLTGFRDFEFVRQALRLGSMDYLLKPVEDERLIESIGKVIRSLDQDTERALASYRLRESVTEYSLEKQQDYWKRVLQRKEDFSIQHRKLDFPFYSISLSPDKPVTSFAVSYRQTGHCSVFDCHISLMHALEKVGGGPAGVAGCLCGTHVSLFLIQSGLEAAAKKLEELQSFFCEQMQLLFSIGRSGPVDWEQWPDEVRRLLSQMEKIDSGTILSPGMDSKAVLEMQGGYIIKAVEEYVQKHPEEDLSLSALSIRFHMNPSYLSRLFRQVTGGQLSAYITDKRMEYAKELLTATDLRIHDVARKSGFDNPNYFSRVFREKEGMLPKEYRQKNAEC